MKDLGSASKILGMQVKRDRVAKTLFLTQAGYVRKLLNKFGMVDVKEVSTPLAAHFKLSKQQEPSGDADIEYMKKVPYSSVVGSIMYAMVCTRGGHILTEPIQTDKILVSVYWIVNRYHSVWILVWKDFKWIQTDPIQNLHFHTYTKEMYTYIHNSISLTIKTKR